MLMAFDRNKDGRLTKSEVPERLQGLFARLDENTDGELTADEIKKAAAAQPLQTPPRGRGEGREGEGRGGPPRRDAFYSALDKNGDGVLSSDEITGAAAALKALDANGDGVIGMEEVFPPDAAAYETETACLRGTRRRVDHRRVGARAPAAVRVPLRQRARHVDGGHGHRQRRG